MTTPMRQLSDMELASRMDAAWSLVRDAMEAWQDLCRENARREGVRRRAARAVEETL